MSVLAVALLYSVAAASATYLGINIRTEQILRSVLFEKVMLYVLGVMFIPVLTFVAHVIVTNDATISYLQSYSLTLFLVTTALGFVVAFGRIGNLVELLFSSRRGGAE